jgi:hypothetical protein
MECESTISFETNSSEKCSALEKAFRKFEGVSISSWSDVQSRIVGFSELTQVMSVPLDGAKIYDYFNQLDTGVTHIDIDGTKLSVDIFPRDFPEELCEYIFPLLENSSCTEISCFSASEYGNQELNFQDGKIEKIENFFEED